MFNTVVACCSVEIGMCPLQLYVCTCAFCCSILGCVQCRVICAFCSGLGHRRGNWYVQGRSLTLFDFQGRCSQISSCVAVCAERDCL